MLLSDLIAELDCCREDGEVLVEINGVQHPIQYINDTSQGTVLVVDTYLEEKEMR